MTQGIDAASNNPLISTGQSRATLIISQKGEPVSVECRHVVTLLGARDGCKVVLRHKRIDPVHMAIVHTGQSILALDLVTRNGSELNGLPLSYDVLSDGDELRFGPWTARVAVESPALRNGNGHDEEEPVDLEPTPQVIALEHVASGRILQPSREACVIGRRPGCDIVVPDLEVSRVHALMFKYRGFPAIFDLLTSNHTYVNDAPVQFSMLKNEDAIRTGESLFRVRLATATVGERVVREASRPREEVAIKLDDPPIDLVDIATTEGANRWEIADHAKKTARSR